MANTIKHKRGSGSNPSASDLAVGELAIRTDTGVVFTKKDDGTVAEIAGGGETNLGVSTTSTAVTVTSDTGNNATISEASGSAAGVMSVAHHDKLDGIESGATADQTKSDIDALGIDADTVDGVEASSFLRSDAADTKTSGDLTFNDSVKAVFGTGSDLEIYHSGSNSFIKDAGTGRLKILTDYLDVENAGATENIIHATADGSVELYHNGAKKLETKSDGIDVTGEVQCDSLDVDGAADITGDVTLHANLDLQDNDKILVGTGDDLEIYHDGSDSYIKDGGTGILAILGSEVRIQNAGGNENCAKFIQDGAVQLYHNNSQKFATKSDGVDITGELQCDSLDVDGGANITGDIDIDGDIRHNGDTNCLFGFPSNDTFRVTTGGTERFRITSTGAIAIEGSSNYGTSGQVLTSNGNDAPTWQDGGGTVASGCVYENSQTISANYSVTSGKNAMSAGPITIASGVTVTVTSGSTYTIV